MNHKPCFEGKLGWDPKPKFFQRLWILWWKQAIRYIFKSDTTTATSNGWKMSHIQLIPCFVLKVTPDVVPKPKCSDVPGSCDGNKQVGT